MNLARQMGVSPALVSLWLSGDRLLSLEDWIAIKKIMRRKR
jgi:DNA-binding transcriptional regulator YdaS (Cro superfamily)